MKLILTVQGDPETAIAVTIQAPAETHSSAGTAKPMHHMQREMTIECVALLTEIPEKR